MKTKRIGAAFLAVACLALGACSSEKAAEAGGDKAMAAVNTNCPYSGKPVNASFGTVAYQGKNIGFCCGGCKSNFESLDDAKKAERVAKLNAAK